MSLCESICLAKGYIYRVAIAKVCVLSVDSPKMRPVSMAFWARASFVLAIIFIDFVIFSMFLMAFSLS